jgi:hypothetical protein
MLFQFLNTEPHPDPKSPCLLQDDFCPTGLYRCRFGIISRYIPRTKRWLNLVSVPSSLAGLESHIIIEA